MDDTIFTMKPVGFHDEFMPEGPVMIPSGDRNGHLHAYVAKDRRAAPAALR